MALSQKTITELQNHLYWLGTASKIHLCVAASVSWLKLICPEEIISPQNSKARVKLTWELLTTLIPQVVVGSLAEFLILKKGVSMNKRTCTMWTQNSHVSIGAGRDNIDRTSSRDDDDWFWRPTTELKVLCGGWNNDPIRIHGGPRSSYNPLLKNVSASCRMKKYGTHCLNCGRFQWLDFGSRALR